MQDVLPGNLSQMSQPPAMVPQYGIPQPAAVPPISSMLESEMPPPNVVPPSYASAVSAQQPVSKI